MFQEYMLDVFRRSKRPAGQTIVSVLANSLNGRALLTLRKLLADLIWRCERSKNGRAAVLNHGGGHAQCVSRQHIPYLVRHVEFLDTVVQKVRVVVARNSAAVESDVP